MLILPLGLGSRLPSAPFMCMVICLCIVGYSIFSFPVMDKFDAAMKSVVDTEELRESATELYLDYCNLRANNAAHCKVTAEYIAERWRENGGKKDRPSRKIARAEADEKELFRDLLLGRREQLKIIEEYGEILKHPEKASDPRVRSLASFQKILSFHREKRETSTRAAKQLGLLSGSNVSFVTLLKAQFTHAGWMHLLTNLAVLILIGIYVEARAGAIWFLAMFLIPGILGMIAHLSLTGDPSRILLGASAGVAGIMGAFLAFYFYQPMKVWFSYLLVYNRIIFIPAYLILGPLFILHDVVGALSVDDGVAHIAHLGGLVVGYVLGRVQRRSAPVAEGMLYADEEFFASKLDGIRNPAKRSEVARQILRWNPSNLAALRSLLRLFALEPGAFDQEETARLLTSYLAISLRHRQADAAYEMAKDMPLSVALADLLERMNTKNHLRLAETALNKGDWLTAIRIYDSLLAKGSNHATKQKILQSVESLYKHVRSERDPSEVLKQLRLSSELKDRIAA